MGNEHYPLTAELWPNMDLSNVISTGSMVCWGQLTGTPVGLVAALDRALPAIGSCSAFIGMTVDNGIQAEHLQYIRFLSFAGAGSNRRYLENGSAEIIPMHLGEVPTFIRSNRIKIDVMLVAVTHHEEEDRVSTGVMTDFLPSVLEHDPIVIGERIAGLPWTFGDTQIPKSKFTSLVDLNSRVIKVPSRPEQPAETRIAQQIVERIPNGATLQFGIGGVPDAVLRGLANHKDIGIHTGILTEPAQALIESGVVTNRLKGIDEGQTITAYLAGTQPFYDFCDHHPALQVKQLEYTHNPSTLIKIRHLISINSAFEVDLTGQVNAETVGGKYLGQVGGQVDFIRGAFASAGGFSIIGLASTDRRETLSRIVPALSDGTVTSLRTDVDLVVTEYGVARLRGRSIGERIDAMINISHPKFRDQLRHASRRL